MLQSIASLFFEVTVVSGTAHDDFGLLCNVTDLVSSDVGTYVIDAALFFRDLGIFHCTDYFKLSISIRACLINPNQVAVKMQVMKGFRRQWHHW